jgi:hypothetical protein
MGIASMGVRSALRTVQDAALTEDADTTPTGNPTEYAVIGSLTTPAGTTIGGPKVPTAGDAEASKLEEISAWIPTETLALWIGLTAGFSLFENTLQEAVVGGILLIATGVLGFLTSLGAHKRRSAPSAQKAVCTGLVASFAFGVYWMAMPGSLATADLNLAPVFPALLLGLTLIFLPMVARALKIEPRRVP